METSIIGIIFGIVLTSLWIFIPLHNIPKERRISKRVYIISIIIGAALCSPCIYILEDVWDGFWGINDGVSNNIWEALATSFMSAALIEELVKLAAVKVVLRKHKSTDKLQYMLLAGTIGMGYGIVEKASLSMGALIISVVFSLHIMFQYIMGGYLYEAYNAKTKSRKWRMKIMAYLVPFLVHGTGDTVLFMAEKYVDSSSDVGFILALLALLLLLVAEAVLEIAMIIYIKRLLREQQG